MSATPNRLRQLRAFCQAAQTASISRAAERLHLSQPTVSQLVKSLERDLGTPLFERHGPRIERTAAGDALLETALPLVEGIDQLPDVFRARMGAVTGGRLDIAAGESTILYLLPDYVKRFTDTHPGVNLHLHNVTGRDGMELLRAGEVDFAVGSMIDVPADIAYIPTFSYEPMLITAPDHPLAGGDGLELADISRCGLILPPRHLSTWHVVDLVFHQHGLAYEVVLEAGGWEVIKRFVELGLGVSIVTSICLRGDEELARIPVGRWFPHRTYGAVIRKGRVLTPQARAFLDMLDPDFAQHAASARPGLHAPHASRGDDGGDTDFSGFDRSLG
ncbi:MAG: LysR family transcriptional regulator [Halofilum sp. (in: g-proteobacteria)]|nr:LysR family transcriptional regulator [Halofilum sp. (in: g-proteobacteria)]